MKKIDFTEGYVYTFGGRPFSGVGFELGSDDMLMCEMEFRNGVQSGTSREYYSAGQVKTEQQYKNNTLHGFVREWDELGVLMSEDEYELGICIRRKVKNIFGQLSICYELSENDTQFEILQLLRELKFAECVEQIETPDV